MTKPNAPTYLFPKPFCDEGTRTQIPTHNIGHGRASLDQGFPTETQLPLNQGGVAPNRTDFNGLLWALSAFAYWQQSGGQFTWMSGLNYSKPAIVFHADKLWWCLTANGPENPAGVVEPGTNETVWQEFLFSLAGQAGGSGGGDPSVIFGGNPVGTVIMYYGVVAPVGYLPCDGSSFSTTNYPRLYEVLGSTITPDLRGYFVRGLGISKGSDELGVRQEDAGRNLTGDLEVGDDMSVGTIDGCISIPGIYAYGATVSGGYSHEKRARINASQQWGTNHTADEFRPVNKALLYCIRHD